MGENEDLEKAMHQIGRDYVQSLKDNLLADNSKASGDLINSIDYEVINENGKVVLNIKSDSYIDYVDKGRGPGKQPPTDPIKKWIEQKGISITGKSGDRISIDSSAFLIARSIGEKGTKGTNVLERTKNQILDSRMYLIEDALVKSILDQI